MMTDAEYFEATGKHFPGRKGEESLETSWKSGTMESRTFRQFNDGEEVNNFFYYDDYEKSHGLIARKNSQHGKWQAGLSADEKDCIADYSGGGFYDLNNYFRQVGDWRSINSEKEEFIAENLDSAISRYVLKDNIRVQRGVMTDFIDRLAEEHDIQSSLSELVGQKYVEKAYSSTTALMANRVATAKPVILDIEVPAGVGRGAYVNQLAGQYQDTEYEFLIKRGASFTIKEVVEKEEMGEYHYYIKLVMDDE